MIGVVRTIGIALRVLFFSSAFFFLSYSTRAAETETVSNVKRQATISKQKSTISKKTVSKKSIGVLTGNRAVELVSARPEVKGFLLGIKNSKMKGVSSHVEFDRKEGDDIVVHVYEYVPDDAESGHTATFNWYHVNSKTGKITKEF
ncbi:MAG: hypothetical protein SGJ27_30860 [Candidatus Melainabacteria bacterium]|nr:hypothetical protein [Candidatus Melainabacteria bacterium]